MRAIILITVLAVSVLGNSQVNVTVIRTTPEYLAQIKKQSNEPATWKTVVNDKTITIDLDKCRKFRDSICNIPQDTLTARFVKCLNAYRVKFRLPALKLNNLITEHAKFIAEYNNNLSGLGLTHQTNIPGKETFSDRVSKINSGRGGECVLKLGTTEGELAFILNLMYKEKISYEQYLLNMWIRSSAHNSILKIKSADTVGFYLKFKDPKQISGVSASVIVIDLN